MAVRSKDEIIIVVKINILEHDYQPVRYDTMASVNISLLGARG